MGHSAEFTPKSHIEALGALERVNNVNFFLCRLKDEGKRIYEGCSYNRDKILSPFYLYPLDYLKRTSHILGFHSDLIQRCDLIHERLQLKLSDEKGFGLQSEDKTIASDG